MNTKSIFLALCCLTAFSSYAQHVPTLEEVVNGGLIVTKGESRVNWLSEGNSYSKKEKNPAGGYDIVSSTPGKNKREVLIPASMFVKPGTSDTLSVRSFSFDTSPFLFMVHSFFFRSISPEKEIDCLFVGVTCMLLLPLG